MSAADGLGIKLQAQQALLNQLTIPLPKVAYLGDDLPDLAAIRAADLSGAGD